MKRHCLLLALSLWGTPQLHAESPCRLTSAQLVKIAQNDQAAECTPASNCELIVMEKERAHWCAVQVWPGPKGSVHLTGNFVTLVISNDGVVLRRISGV
jgi:hypothetical protein